MKIFIVENHRDTLIALELFFRDLGHTVESAGTMAEALDRVPRSAPDLLLCDIGLPDGTGWELLNALPAMKKTFSVAMSGFGMNADSTRSREAGFRAHLLKPFSAGELARILAQAAAELNLER